MVTTNRNSAIDEIKSRCNIVDIIGSVVSLKKTGANFQGLCPFHNEKTPSFVVSETKQIFTCFGCNASGDVIEFVMKYYKLSFLESVEKLAEHCGVQLDNNFNRSEKKDIFFEVNREAARFFYKNLRNSENPGINYVYKRKLSKETLREFGIGYADDSWNSLYEHLKQKGYDDDVMLKLGLISKAKGRYYDKFRNRIIFPIQNTAGKIIGFGGRAIGSDMPKYLNSPETPVFSKKNNLYGLNISKNYVNEKDCIILVEGYMDVISLYQGGVKNVAASLGTALTENQGKLLKRYTNNVVLSYDADSAGTAAAIRGSEILHKENCKVKILHISDGKDPDDFIKSKGKLAYYKLVEEALPYGDYMIETLSKRYDISTTHGRVDFLKNVAKFLESLSPVEGDIYIEKVSKKYRISEGALRTEMGINDEKEEVQQYKVTDNDKINDDISIMEKNIIKVILTDSKYIEKIGLNRDIFASELGENIYKNIEKIYIKNEEIDIGNLIDNLDSNEIEVVKDIQKNISLGGNIESIFNECIKYHVEETLYKKEKDLILQISIADEQQNTVEIERLTKELINIQKERI